MQTVEHKVGVIGGVVHQVDVNHHVAWHEDGIAYSVGVFLCGALHIALHALVIVVGIDCERSFLLLIVRKIVALVQCRH